MGIKKIKDIITKYAPNGIVYLKDDEMKKLSGKIAIVDASNIIYKYVMQHISTTGKVFKNKKGSMTSHVHAIFTHITSLLNNGIIPIYVFDGKCGKEKKEEIKKRRSKKDIANKKLKQTIKDEPNNKEKIKKYLRESLVIKSRHFRQCKRVCRYLGIPYIQAEYEADPVCTYISNNSDHVYGCISEDMDFLAYKCPNLIRELKINKSASIYNLKKIKQELGMTQENLINLSVLLGSDYTNTTIKGVGTKTGYTLIKKYGTIKKIIENIKNGKLKYYVPDEFIENYQSAINMFTKNYKEKENIPDTLSFGEININKINLYLETKDFNMKGVKTKLDKYINLFKKYKLANKTINIE